MNPKKIKPLYRKVNTRARGVQHNFGSDYKKTRRRETAIGMRQKVLRGLDYTPLFKFLLSKVGCNWNDIHSEALSRLDKQEPLYWIVAINKEDKKDYVRVGESSYFSGLYVTDNNILNIVSPEITENTLKPSCPCCTHTFNGIPFSKKFCETQ